MAPFYSLLGLDANKYTKLGKTSENLLLSQGLSYIKNPTVLFYTYLALDKSCSSTSSSLRLLATLLLSPVLLSPAVVAITEDKSLCGTGGGQCFASEAKLSPLVKLRSSSKGNCPLNCRSDVVLLTRCDGTTGPGAGLVGRADAGPRSGFLGGSGRAGAGSWQANSRSLSRPSSVLACSKDMGDLG